MLLKAFGGIGALGLGIVLASCAESTVAPAVEQSVDVAIAWDESTSLSRYAPPGSPGWTSSDTTVVTVDAAGNATGRRGGVAVIRAAGSVEVNIVVTVELRLIDVAAGWTHTCGLTPTHRLVCWGSNAYGQLAVQRALPGSQSLTPVAADISDTLLDLATSHQPLTTSVATTGGFTCGRVAAASTVCWGGSTWGETGSVSDGVNTPSRITGADASGALAVGSNFACALDRAGTTRCWGANTTDVLSSGGALSSCPHRGGPGGAFDTCRLFAAALGAGPVFSKIAAGSKHACGIALDGSAYCWGYGGLLGADSLPDGSLRARPVGVSTAARFTQIASGLNHTCALTTDGAAYCWGSNGAGQLGNGTTDTVTHVPQRVGGLPALVSLSAGDDYTCGLTTSGQAYCWGAGLWGQLGDGQVHAASQAVRAAPSYTFVKLSAGARHVCAVTAQFAAYCWGDGEAGKLGNGSTSGSAVPVRVGPPQ